MFEEGIDAFLDKITKPFYVSLVSIIYSSYLLAYFGIFYIKPEYIKLVSFIAQSFVCFFLMYRFNPLREAILKKNDKIIIFGSAMIIFINLISSELLRLYREQNQYFMEIARKIFGDMITVGNSQTGILPYNLRN